MSTTAATSEPAPLTDEQRARVAALRVAREVIRNGTVFAGGDQPEAVDLVDLAEYILTGANPLDGYGDEVTDEQRALIDAADGIRGTGCSVEIAGLRIAEIATCARCGRPLGPGDALCCPQPRPVRDNPQA